VLEVVRASSSGEGRAELLLPLWRTEPTEADQEFSVAVCAHEVLAADEVGALVVVDSSAVDGVEGGSCF
jgi:hypothetical protein